MFTDSDVGASAALIPPIGSTVRTPPPTPVVQVLDEARQVDEMDAVTQMDPIGLTTITTYLKGYLATNSGDRDLSETAIDQKIEQALDLVKYHLLFAVREKIVSLKKQIIGLSERNRQLEKENNFLRNAALAKDIQKIHQMSFHF